MESLSRLVRVTLADYFRDLPIPDTVSGWFSLSLSDWMRLVPFGAAVGGLSYLSVKGLTHTPGVGPFLQDRLSKLPGFAPTRVNKKVKMDCSKIVDTVDMEDIGDKAVFCRCWKSSKFPYCDGSHNKHNDETGDNVGPLIVKKSS